MSFRMHRYPDGLTGLAAFCDVCNEQITEHGFVVWNFDDPDDLLVIHQGRCDPGRPRYDASMALDVEIIHLANSAGIDLKKAQRLTATLAALG